MHYICEKTMRKKIVITVAVALLFNYALPQRCNVCAEIKHVQDVPYMPELQGDCPDSVYWCFVRKGLDMVPSLIDCINSTDSTQIMIPNWGGHYTVGDIAFAIICDIIHDLPIQDFFLNGVVDERDNGPITYHSFLSSSEGNRRILQRQLRRWYRKNRHCLIWITDDSEWRTADDCWWTTNKHPAGGYFKAK